METLVPFQPYSFAVCVLFTLVFLAAAAGFLVFPFFGARDVTIDASHETSQLVVTKTYPLFGQRRDIYDLASIRGTSLRSRRAKNGSLTYALFLRTDLGEQSISFAYSPGWRQVQQRNVDAFLANPEAPPLHLSYDRGSPLIFLASIASVIFLWVLWTVWQSATVRFEWWRDAVVLERRRWPLPLWTRAFQLGELTGACVSERGYRSRKTYRVDLTLGSGETVPLLTTWGSSPGPTGAAAAAINAALERKEPAQAIAPR
jgi:hypothetical protein